MHIESIRLSNFRCFGAVPVLIDFAPNLTAFIGSNGTGKTAACMSLQRMFGISSEERTIRADDFHVSPAEVSDSAPDTRSLKIDVVLAFPELDTDDGDVAAVPEFFRRMVTDTSGQMKCRIVLEAVWTKDGTIDGSIESRIFCVTTLNSNYSEADIRTISPAERSRIQFVYVPASKDGSKQVAAFLRGRLWKAATWSSDLKEFVRQSAMNLNTKFHEEAATRSVEDAFARRWRELQGADRHSSPHFQPIEPDIEQLLRGAELTFAPDPSSPTRAARLLSDGQRSLLHLALTTATLDLEGSIVNDSESGFESSAAYIPAFTILAIEEPENNLSPYYLSRILSQLHDLGSTERVQALLSTHSASALGRVDPRFVRHFRQDASTATSIVRSIKLPENDEEAATYIREAVKAHPELYFARFVILGEGDSEQIVIPRLARALDIDLDPAFVSMVPLGGRHTHHFWRLLTDLEIPHATLLDFDHGRAGGGPGRYRTAIRNLEDNGISILDEIDGYETLADITDETKIQDLVEVREALQQYGVFFSSPLDLDMLMLNHYWDTYTKLGEGQRGPDSSDATTAVLGTGGTRLGKKFWAPADDEKRTHRNEDLRWYRYLFTNRSKPATHLSALSRLGTSEIRNDLPPVLNAMITFVQSEITR